MKTFPQNKRKDLFILVFIILATLLTYSNHFQNSFHFDDSHTIQENIHIRSLSNIPKFFYHPEMFSASPSHWGLRPLVTTTLAIDYHLAGGLNPYFFHISNFSYHILIVLLVFVMYKHFFTPKFQKNGWKQYVYLFAVSVFALHTVNAETINYIISRSDLLSTLCIFASFTLYVLKPQLRKYYLYILPAILGVMAKETIATLPILIFFYVLLFEKNMDLRKIFKRENLKVALLIFTSLLPLILSIAALQYYTLSMAVNLSDGVSNPFFPYWRTQTYVWLHYFMSYFLPFNLSADTDISIISNPFDTRIISGVVFIIALLAAIIKTSSNKEWRPVSMGLIWFVVALLPTSLAPLAEVLNDHRMYFPFIGLNMAVVYFLGMFISGYEENISGKWLKPALLSLSLLIPATFAYGAYQRNKVWKNAESLWYDVTVKSPQNGRGLMNYGLTLMAKGQYAEAMNYYNSALKYVPYYPHLHINMGIDYGAMGMNAKAEESFQNALKYGGEGHLPHYYYGKYLYDQRRFMEAKDHLEQALKKNPYHQESRHLLMNLYSELSDTVRLNTLINETLAQLPEDEVALQYKNGYALKPQSDTLSANGNKVELNAEKWLNISLDFYNQAKYQECINACMEALKIKPNFAEAYNNICSAHNAMGHWHLAIEACEKAVRIRPDFQLAINNMNYAKKQLVE